MQYILSFIAFWKIYVRLLENLQIPDMLMMAQNMSITVGMKSVGVIY